VVEKFHPPRGTGKHAKSENGKRRVVKKGHTRAFIGRSFDLKEGGTPSGQGILISQEGWASGISWGGCSSRGRKQKELGKLS